LKSSQDRTDAGHDLFLGRLSELEDHGEHPGVWVQFERAAGCLPGRVGMMPMSRPGPGNSPPACPVTPWFRLHEVQERLVIHPGGHRADAEA
jgi:hypothetical protein